MLSRDGHIYWFGNYGIEIEFTPKKSTLYKNKFINIASYSYYEISIALLVNGIFYIWGNCGKEVIKESKETELKSFENIFAHFY